MKTVSLELPDPLYDFAMARVEAHGFTSISEYVRSLVRREGCFPELRVPDRSFQIEGVQVPPVTVSPSKSVYTYSSWRNAVISSLRRYCAQHGRRDVYRHGILQEELDKMVEETRSRGRTPEMTFNRVMQELRDEGLVEFVNNNGHYRFLGELDF